jgi:hypothetical protein
MCQTHALHTLIYIIKTIIYTKKPDMTVGPKNKCLTRAIVSEKSLLESNYRMLTGQFDISVRKIPFNVKFTRYEQ